MCLANLTIFPCHHAVLTSYMPCRPGAHPQNCTPVNLVIYAAPPQSEDSSLPSTCPGSKLGRTCLLGSPKPKQFAEHCVSSGISLEDSIAIAPAWMFDLQGNKIGTRAKPWRLSDYVIALGRARNPRAIEKRISSIKRKAEEERWAEVKKLKSESTESGESDGSTRQAKDSDYTSQNDLESPNSSNAVMKIES